MRDIDVLKKNVCRVGSKMVGDQMKLGRIAFNLKDRKKKQQVIARSEETARKKANDLLREIGRVAAIDSCTEKAGELMGEGCDSSMQEI